MNHQYLSCPANCAGTYVEYMGRRKIPFRRLRRFWDKVLKQWTVEFRIPRNVRPHQWKLVMP